MTMTASASWIEEIRGRLAQPPPRRLPVGESRQAAVLIPLYVDAGELWTLLTKRTEHLPSHKGQFAFPGGSLELGEDPWSAALREAQEEIGLAPKQVLRLGQLDEAETPAGFSVVPCVGAMPFPFATEINPEEIAEVFAVPLSAFANPRMIEDRSVVLDGRRRLLRVYHLGNRRIWGITARILENLMMRLGLAAYEDEVN